MRVFGNAQNGYREKIGWGDGAGTLFLGGFWLLQRGLYVFGLLQLFFLAVAIFVMTTGNDNTAGAAFFFLLLPNQIGWAIAAPTLVARNLARMGWREISSEPSSAIPPATEKTCPMCAESIKAAAVICRHCGHRFEAPTL